MALVTASTRSCNGRGGRTAHEWSRRNRRSSPNIVGIAYVRSGTPQDGS
jgi:hypothetical protein